MFLLYAVAAGLLVGFLIGGRPAGLATLEFRWAWLAIAGFAVQIVLFSGPIADRVGETAGSAIYVASTAAVFIAVLRNARITGLPIVALGAASNLAAIVANGGHMPTSAAAAAAAGRDAIVGYSNSAIVEHPNLAPLTDVFALPPGLPMSNVFSIGDVLIAVGIAATIAVAMRRRPSPAPNDPPTAPESGVRPDATAGPESA
jgi:hypothetical protein